MKNKIAAIVVTYNRLNMLKENIDFLKKQTEQNFDILYFKKKIKIVLKSRDYKMKRERILIKGFYAGLFFNPKIEFVNQK